MHSVQICLSYTQKDNFDDPNIKNLVNQNRKNGSMKTENMGQRKGKIWVNRIDKCGSMLYINLGFSYRKRRILWGKS